MDDRTLALKLVLRHLGVGESIETVDERMEVQKAIYLTQAAGLSLGFSYGWYLKGPYSPSLTKVYYALENLAAEDETRLAKASLKAPVTAVLNKVNALMKRKPVELDRPRWLELLASVHYLIRESGFSKGMVKKRIDKVKDHLTAHVNDGIRALEAEGLISKA